MLIHFKRLLLTAFLLPAFASAQDTTATRIEQFALGPGDVVRVKIWREKDLNGDYMVDEGGRLILPLLGSRQVAGIPWATLHDSLLSAYGRELKAPSVILIPMRRVFVMGEVTKPGTYLADPTLTLAGAVALAGGASPQGDQNHLRVVRGGHTIINDAPIDGPLFGGMIRSGDQIFVERRSWFDRNSAFVASAVVSLTSIAVSLLRR